MEVINKQNSLQTQTQKQGNGNKRKNLKLYKIIKFKIKPLEFQIKKAQKRNLVPGVGVGVFLIDSMKNKLLLGKRKESGHFGLPGGWLELGEEWEDCAARELKEETGLMKPNYTFSHVYTLNCRKLEFNYHNISCIMMNEILEYEFEKIYNREPNKCHGWFWTSVEMLRKNMHRLFHPLQDFLTKFPHIKSATDIKNMIKTYNNIKKDFN